MILKTQISFGVLILGLSLTGYAWWATVDHLFNLIRTVDVFAHGQIVPIVSLVLIWSRREMLAKLTPAFSLWGLVVFVGAIALWLFGELLDSAFFSHLGLVTAVQGIVLFSFGFKIYRTVLFPMGFLYLVVPFGYALVTDLQHLTANMVILVLDVIGADYTAEGVLIKLPSGYYEVAQACAGIRFLFTSIVTSILLANLVFQSWKRRVMILCVGVVLPIVANIIRVLTILAIAEMTDQSFAQDVDHIIYGWVFLSLVLLALISFAYKVSDATHETPVNVHSQSVVSKEYKYSIIGCIAFLLPLAAATVFPSQFAQSYREGEQVTSELYQIAPKGYRRLITTPVTPVPVFLNAEQQHLSILRDNSVVFSVYAATYDTLGPGRRIYQTGNSLVSAHWEEVTSLQRRGPAVCGQNIQERIFQNGDKQIITWSLYRVDKRSISSSLEEKLISAYAKFRSAPSKGEVVVLSAPIAGDFDAVRNVFIRYLEAELFKKPLWAADLAGKKGTDICAE